MTGSRPRLRLSRRQAARIALAAQGFDRHRPPTPTMRHLQGVIDRVGVVQIDSVNVVARSQYLPFYSRLGAYDTRLLDRARDVGPRRLVEYWAHEASLIAPSTWPLLGFRMRRARAEAWGGMRRVAQEHPELLAAVRAEVERRGPLTSREVEAALEHDAPRDRAEWGWNWSLVKQALELLFWAGEVSSAGRTSQFERRYAVPARVFPAGLRDLIEPSARPPDEVAHRELIMLAARAHGIATAACLRDYFRLRPAEADPALEALVAAGRLVPVTVDGWRSQAYLDPQARRPRRIEARALLSPFDSLIWTRSRTAALFGFDYRLEIYVPSRQRVHGYYVLPFLLGQDLVARVDLKTDRSAAALLARRVTWQPGRGGASERTQLRSELEEMAGWLALSELRMLES